MKGAVRMGNRCYQERITSFVGYVIEGK